MLTRGMDSAAALLMVGAAASLMRVVEKLVLWRFYGEERYVLQYHALLGLCFGLLAYLPVRALPRSFGLRLVASGLLTGSLGALVVAAHNQVWFGGFVPDTVPRVREEFWMWAIVGAGAFAVASAVSSGFRRLTPTL